MNIVAIQCITNTGELMEVPVREFFSMSGELSITPTGTVPKSNGKEYVASGITVDANGVVTFKSYTKPGIIDGTASGIIAHDANGRLISVPITLQGQTQKQNVTQSSTGTSTENVLPVYSDGNGTLSDSTILKDGENYSVGGAAAFFKWDVSSGSVNINQGTSVENGYRLNGKLVVSYDPATEEITIGNATYTTTNIENVKVKSAIFTTALGGTITDVAFNTAGNYTLIKPAENGTYATREWANANTWLINGNTVTVEKAFGTLDDFNIPIIQNGNTVAVFNEKGAAFPAIQEGELFEGARDFVFAGIDLAAPTKQLIKVTNSQATQYLSNYLWKVGGNTLVSSQVMGSVSGSDFDIPMHRNGVEVGKWRTGGLTVPTLIASNLTTNYVPKHTASGLSNSLLYSSTTGIGIGTAVPYENFEVANAATGGRVIFSDGGQANRYALLFSSPYSGQNYARILAYKYGTGAGGLNLVLNDSGGNVGIGIVNPSYKLDVNGTSHFTGAVTFDTVPSSLQDATSSNHLVRYSQWIASTSVKYLPTAVKTVSLTNITLSGTQTVNGVALIAGDRILVAGQTTASANGVYIVAAGAWTRSTDGDTDAELRGFIVNISGGTYAGYKYINTNTSAITVGTTSVTYAEFSNLSEIDPVFTAWIDNTRSANTFWAAPNGSNGVATWRGLVAADVPTLNQSTTGSAATLTTARNIAMTGDVAWSVSFNGSADVTGAGTLATISDSGSGTFLKVTRNTKGLITGTQAVAQADITGLLGANSITNTMINSLDWSKLTSVPTTLSGYGITDAYTKTESDGRFVHLTGNEDIFGQKIFKDTLAIKNSSGNGLLLIQGDYNQQITGNGGISIKPEVAFNVTVNGIGSIGATDTYINMYQPTTFSSDITYNGLLKIGASSGTTNQVLMRGASNNAWITLTHSHISNLSSYTGFDTNYYTKALADGRFVHLEGDEDIQGNKRFTTGSTTFLYPITIEKDATSPSNMELFLKNVNIRAGSGVSNSVATVGQILTKHDSADRLIWRPILSSYITDVNAANKLLKLNSSGLIDSAYLPAYVDDVLEYANFASLPSTGATGKIYVTIDTNKQYRWSGSTYVQITDGKATWGGIDGTLSAQTDLQDALNLKANLTSNTFTGQQYFNAAIRFSGNIPLRIYGSNTYNGKVSIVNNLIFGDPSVGVYAPAFFKASDFMFNYGNVKIGGANLSDSTVNWATEKLDVDGNIRYSGTLKPNNVAPTAGQVLRATNAIANEWATLTTGDISNLSAYVGFDARYVQVSGTYIDPSWIASLSFNKISGFPTGSRGQFLTIDEFGQANFMNLEIMPTFLGDGRIAVGDSQNCLSELDSLRYSTNRLKVHYAGNMGYSLEFGYNGTNESLITSNTNLRLTANDIFINNLTGSTTRYVTVDASGKLGSTASAGGGTVQNLDDVLGVGNIGINKNIKIKTSTSHGYELWNNSDFVRGGLYLDVATDTVSLIASKLNIETGSGKIIIDAQDGSDIEISKAVAGSFIVLNGTKFSFHEDLLYQGSNTWGSGNNQATPQEGDIINFRFSGGKFVLNKV